MNGIPNLGAYGYVPPVKRFSRVDMLAVYFVFGFFLFVLLVMVFRLVLVNWGLRERVEKMENLLENDDYIE